MSVYDDPNAPFWIGLQTGVPWMIYGPPGVTKTQSLYAFARQVERPLYVLIGSLRDPADIGGYPTVRTVEINGQSKTVMDLAPPAFAEMLACQRGILFLDEFNNATPAVRAAMMRPLAEGVVGDIQLHPETWMAGACNPPDIAVDATEFEAPIANRMGHLEWTMNFRHWSQGLARGLRWEAPEFPVLPAEWKDQLPLAGSLVSAFYERRPDLFSACPKDRKAQSGAWPSPRTWTFATKCIAACQSLRAPKVVEHRMIEGCVGTAAANEFATWRDQLDIPAPEDVLAAAAQMAQAGEAFTCGRLMEVTTQVTAGRKANNPFKLDRGDKVIALLVSVQAAITSDLTDDRWESAMHVIEAVFSEHKETALVVLGGIMRLLTQLHIRKLPPSFVKNVVPFIDAASAGLVTSKQ